MARKQSIYFISRFDLKQELSNFVRSTGGDLLAVKLHVWHTLPSTEHGVRILAYYWLHQLYLPCRTYRSGWQPSHISAVCLFSKLHQVSSEDEEGGRMRQRKRQRSEEKRKEGETRARNWKPEKKKANRIIQPPVCRHQECNSKLRS